MIHYIFNQCNKYKEHSSNKPMFLFTESKNDIKAVFSHIENNLETYFDEDNERCFEQLKQQVKDGEELSKAISECNCIYASVTEIEHVKNL